MLLQMLPAAACVSSTWTVPTVEADQKPALAGLTAIIALKQGEPQLQSRKGGAISCLQRTEGWQ